MGRWKNWKGVAARRKRRTGFRHLGSKGGRRYKKRHERLKDTRRAVAERRANGRERREKEGVGNAKGVRREDSGLRAEGDGDTEDIVDVEQKEGERGRESWEGAGKLAKARSV